jgi:hypothetical protein
MKWTVLPPVVISLGLALMVISWAWPVVMPVKSVWSEEQAQDRSEASADVHRLHYEYHAAVEREQGSGSNSAGRGGAMEASGRADEIKVEYDKAKSRLQRSSEELKSARSFRLGLKGILWWSGIVFSLVGVGGYFVLRMEWAKQYVEP